ncbi:translation elongation factor EF-1 subunit alpha [Candidatus Borrarchaeum sp.]|uniref:translation elongation factor EF-1 subunit alpha n=1 Tax=Candidatus Borrarchaeum sp. TaxID=2846742 RepID=UPI00257AECE7|nr:translation elongation factor EF-1 subunit alpha [Candidatus Borrarchaeum sp.]
MSKSGKPHMNLVIIGHVDHGKSTLVGHLLVLMGAIDERTIAKYEADADKIGKGSFKYAWVLDKLKEERERGLTIDIAFWQFETPKYYYTIIDAPGHRDFVKNMITGTSQADAAILAVSSRKGEFESGIGKGGQTVEHLVLAATLGVDQFIVAVNKMDAADPQWDEDRFNEIKSNVENVFKLIEKELDMKITRFYIPVSAWTGDNITKASENMGWFKEPTILQALDQMKIPPQPTDKPLRIPIQDVYTITGVGTVPVGRVETGILKAGDKIHVEPVSKVGEVKSIEMHHEQMEKAMPGDNIGFNLKGIAKAEIRRGDVAGDPKNPPSVAKEFTAQIFILHHPTAIAAGYTPVIHAHTAQVASTFLELQAKIDRRSGEIVEENPPYLKTGEGAIVKLVPTRPLCIEEYASIPQLGRFAIRDMAKTVGVGIVKSVTKR